MRKWGPRLITLVCHPRPEWLMRPRSDSFMGGATGGWYLLTAELADRTGQRRRQEVPDIVARFREAL